MALPSTARPSASMPFGRSLAVGLHLIPRTTRILSLQHQHARNGYGVGCTKQANLTEFRGLGVLINCTAPVQGVRNPSIWSTLGSWWRSDAGVSRCLRAEGSRPEGLRGATSFHWCSHHICWRWAWLDVGTRSANGVSCFFGAVKPRRVSAARGLDRPW